MSQRVAQSPAGCGGGTGGQPAGLADEVRQGGATRIEKFGQGGHLDRSPRRVRVLEQGARVVDLALDEAGHVRCETYPAAVGGGGQEHLRVRGPADQGEVVGRVGPVPDPGIADLGMPQVGVELVGGVVRQGRDLVDTGATAEDGAGAEPVGGARVQPGFRVRAAG